LEILGARKRVNQLLMESERILGFEDASFSMRIKEGQKRGDD
jgi:hypothetical protein